MQPNVLLADPALGVPRARRFAVPARRRSVRIRWRWLLIAALLAVAGGGLAFLRMWPPLATVMSGSMAPTINTGDMVLLKRLDHPARLGDVVAVDVPDEARSRYGYPAVVIHRVIRIAADGTVTTKGDARKEPDPFTVPRAALGAEVVAKVPAGGRVLAFLSSGLGLLWLGAGAVLLFAMPLLDRQRDMRRRTETAAGGLRAQLESITEELAELRYERLAERSALARRCDELSHDAAASQEQLQLVTAAFTEHLQQLPGQLAAAVAAARPEPPPVP
jgi:signal peptidase I